MNCSNEDKIVKADATKPIGTLRRTFLIGVVAAMTAAAWAQKKKKIDGGLVVIEDKIALKRTIPIIPPGSLSAENMARYCATCQFYVAQCPSDVLRPSTNLMKSMQPTMSFERGYCHPGCARYSNVCPTGAIRPITRTVKSTTQIDHAVWVKKNCIPFTDGVKYSDCARHCPAGVITMVPSKASSPKSPKVPAVNIERCIGYGACESQCPAHPFSATYAEGYEMHRIT